MSASASARAVRRSFAPKLHCWRPSSHHRLRRTTCQKNTTDAVQRTASLLGRDTTDSAATNTGNMPLQINQDLMLYRARGLRTTWMKSKNKTSVKAMKVFNACMEQYQEALACDPTDARAYVGLGQLLMRAGRLDDARLVYEEGNLSCGGDNAYLWQALAVLEERSGRYREARECFDAATVADKTHAAAWHGWGMLEQRQGNIKRARDLFISGVRTIEEQVQQQRNDAEGGNSKNGTTASAAAATANDDDDGDDETGNGDEEETHKTDTKHVDYLYQSLAVMAIRAERFDEAREWFSRGTDTTYSQTGPKNSAMWEGWARMERDLGNYARARELYQLGLRASPRSRYLWLGWALLERKVKNFERSRTLFARGVAVSSDSVLLQAWGCLEAEDMHDIPRARELFERAIEANPKSLSSWQAYGRMEWRSGNVECARDLFQRGIWANPDAKGSCHIFQAWGVLERYEGNISLARELFKCAIRIDPRSKQTWDAWWKLEEDQGNYLRAQELRSLCSQSQVAEDSTTLDFSPSVLVDGDSSSTAIGGFIKRWMQSVEL